MVNNNLWWLHLGCHPDPAEEMGHPFSQPYTLDNSVCINLSIITGSLVRVIVHWILKVKRQMEKPAVSLLWVGSHFFLYYVQDFSSESNSAHWICPSMQLCPHKKSKYCVQKIPYWWHFSATFNLNWFSTFCPAHSYKCPRTWAGCRLDQWFLGYMKRTKPVGRRRIQGVKQSKQIFVLKHLGWKEQVFDERFHNAQSGSKFDILTNSELQNIANSIF